LIRDAGSALYNVTQQGGLYNLGMAFVLNSGGALTILYSFSPDGDSPIASLVRERPGELI
jgi:uncharacterized repeat protein (TIGR03803 family)